MNARHGFTLIESLITTLVLVTGLAAVAAAFSYSVLTASRVLEETTAIALVSSKMEDLKVAQDLTAGRHSEFIDVTEGRHSVVSEPGVTTYLRTWEITSESPARITVTVHRTAPGPGNSPRELARATTLAAGRF